ncbi:MAG: Asp-tRNA(Asn)/Glu-tRNA(Gln) amidotransferase subunit GatC [Cytophagia bacterium]|nr:Asp-tRNA(Asn)/Glu-tRNA(Gln) amidotransferase subunit GatC [Cytophagia bacterium]
MKVNLETLERITHLARLEWDPDRAEAMLQDMNRFLEYARVLDQAPTEGVEPLVYMNVDGLPPREDRVIAETTHDEALMNAPAKDSDYFRVPKVLKKSGG